MAETKEVIFILGAGFNRVAKDWDGDSPPLANDLFKIVLKKKRYNREFYFSQNKELFDYIEKRFKKNKEKLASEEIDLELCFTSLELNIREAWLKKDYSELKTFQKAYYDLEMLLADILCQFENFAYNVDMRNFGKIIVYENPTIITFNYDCILEAVIKSAYGLSLTIPPFEKTCNLETKRLSDELVSYSHYKWNKPLGYGFKFDEIQLQQAGIPKFVKGKRFYDIPNNELYCKPLLKLHGSLNWSKYSQPPTRRFPDFFEKKNPKLGKKASEIILKNAYWFLNFPSQDHNGWIVEPVIITPVLYKDRYYNTRPFKEIWERAKQALAKAKKLVFIGYSFSPTDFSTKHLLIESLIDNNLEEITVVNPDHNVLKTVEEICHTSHGIKWFRSLEDYNNSFANVIDLEKETIIPTEQIPKDTSPHDVFAKCKICGFEFPVGIRTNPRSFATSRFIDNAAVCPNRHICSYNKEDYILKKS